MESVAAVWMKSILQEGEVLSQVSVEADELFARADFVHRLPDGRIDIYEVKASARVDQTYKYDLAFQYLVLSEKYEIRNAYLLIVNKNYRRGIDLEPKKFVRRVSMTKAVKELLPEIKIKVAEALKTLKLQTPEGLRRCTHPKDCPCKDLCYPNLPDYSVFDIARLNRDKTEELVDMGILDIVDVPADFSLSEKQWRQVEVARTGKPKIDKIEIRRMLNDMQYPLYFLDYEAYNPVTPLFSGYKPYGFMVFQYSLHKLESPDADLEHTEFLATKNQDPAAGLLQAMQDEIDDKGSVIVWSASFEANRNLEMALLYPEFKEFLEGLNLRIFDLMDVFQQDLYIHPGFKGSNSIKKVLPVLVPHLDYSELEIADGTSAMLGWNDLIFGALGKKERHMLTKQMLDYCEMDTLAMVEIWRVLYQLAFEDEVVE